LDTDRCSDRFGSFLFISFWLSARAGNVSSTDNIFSEFTFWFGMFILEHGKWATSHSDSGVTGSWSVSWGNGIKFDTWLSIFEETRSSTIFLDLFLGFITVGFSNFFLLLFFLNLSLIFEFLLFNRLLLSLFDGIIVAFIDCFLFFFRHLVIDTLRYIYYRSVLSQRLTQEKRDSH